MKKIEVSLIKAQCLKYAMDSGLTIDKLDDTSFIASSNDCVVNVEYSHLYNQFQQGHSIEETLQNESCFCGEY